MPTWSTILRTRGVRVALAALIAIVTLGAAGLLGELAIRYREARRVSVPGTMPPIYYRHARLSKGLVRSTDYYGWVRINRFGFRGPPMPVAPSPDTIRIMVVGGSTTFDLAVTAEDRTWPARLQHHLRLAGIPAEVINAGVPGYSVLDNIVRLQMELYRFAPHAIVLYHAHNDVFGTLRYGRRDPAAATGRRPDAMPAVAGWRMWLERHSLLYGKLLGRWQAIRSGTADAAGGAGIPDDQIDTTIAAGARRFARGLNTFAVMAREFRIPLIMPGVVQVSGVHGAPATDQERAMWRRAVPWTSPENVVRTYDAFNETIRAVADRHGAYFVPPDSGLAGVAFFAAEDPVHFNDRGADRMARHVAAHFTVPPLSRIGGPPPGR